MYLIFNVTLSTTHGYHGPIQIYKNTQQLSFSRQSRMVELQGNEFERMLKELVVGPFDVLFWYSQDGMRKQRKISVSITGLWARFKPGTSWTHSRSAAHSPPMPSEISCMHPMVPIDISMRVEYSIRNMNTSNAVPAQCSSGESHKEVLRPL